jgi:hypothetical protein
VAQVPHPTKYTPSALLRDWIISSRGFCAVIVFIF